jgi:hypothetical protein
MPNPQPGGPGYRFLSGSSPLTCLAWEALPVAYTTASIALGILWPPKPHHYIKVGIPSGGMIFYSICYFLVLLMHILICWSAVCKKRCKLYMWFDSFIRCPNYTIGT